jgi:DNA modification methylase
MAYNPKYAKAAFKEFETVNEDTVLEDLNFNWREKDLPERVRTKHVHRLHPYLGKFVPQLVEIILRKFRPKIVCDPFCGSGTTLVEANALGITSVGSDISAFNCLLTRVKTGEYDIDKLSFEIKDALNKTKKALEKNETEITRYITPYLKEWYAEKSLKELLCYRSIIDRYKYNDVLKIILSRATRSARLTTHFDLDFPKAPQKEPYYCYKHGRECKPTEEGFKFLKRYSLDTLKRIKEFSVVKTNADVAVFEGDARKIKFPDFDLVLTSPPYVGLIDYHEQHRYAFELLGLEEDKENEIGCAERGSSLNAIEDYKKGIKEVFINLMLNSKSTTKFVIIVHDKKEIYDAIATELGFSTITRINRHVNRRTGRRNHDFYESILVWETEV